MNPEVARHRSTGFRIWMSAATLTAVAGGLMIASGFGNAPKPSPQQSAAASRPLPTATASPTAASPLVAAPAKPLPASRPVHLDIPRIHVHVPVTAVELLRDGTIDSRPSPKSAAFSHLGSIHRGDTVDIARADGVVTEFTVDSVEAVKDAFVADKVYSRTDPPTLRLVTRAKADKRSGSIVVTAHLSGSRKAPRG